MQPKTIGYPLLWIVLVFGMCLPISSCGWGANGHRFITDTAVEELPQPLKSFFQTYKALFKDQAATEPPGNHFIDIDYYPEFFSHTFPHDLNVLNAEYGSGVVANNGLGPWTALSNYNTLRASFAAARTQADWTNLLTIAGAAAHYLEDLHNPMHLATNYNGQYTGQTGLHSRYETILINYRLSGGLTLVTNPTACIYYPSLLDAIFNDIDLVYPNNAPLLAADLAAYAAAGDRASDEYYQHLWDGGCSGFTPPVMQKAADMVASALYSAWRDAGFPQPFGAATPPLVTLRFVSLDNTACRLAILGDAGQRLDLYTTTDLSNWTWQVSVTNLDGHIEIALPPPAGQLQRFYRVITSPQSRNTLILCPPRRAETYTVPNSATTIGSDAFLYSQGLTHLVVPSSVTSTGDGACSVLPDPHAGLPATSAQIQFQAHPVQAQPHQVHWQQPGPLRSEGIEWAERINEQIMHRRYQEHFKRLKELR